MKHEVYVGIEVDNSNLYLATHLVVDGINVAYTRKGAFYDTSKSGRINAPRKLIQFIVESFLLAGVEPDELYNFLWGWHKA